MTTPLTRFLNGDQPLVGKMVLFVMDEKYAEQANRLMMLGVKYDNFVHQACRNQIAYKEEHVPRSNKAHPGQVFPMLVCRQWGEGMVNGQIFVDGNFTLWATSVSEASREIPEGSDETVLHGKWLHLKND